MQFFGQAWLHIPHTKWMPIHLSFTDIWICRSCRKPISIRTTEEHKQFFWFDLASSHMCLTCLSDSLGHVPMEAPHASDIILANHLHPCCSNKRSTCCRNYNIVLVQQLRDICIVLFLYSTNAFVVVTAWGNALFCLGSCLMVGAMSWRLLLGQWQVQSLTLHF